LTTLDGQPVSYSAESTHTYTDGVKSEGGKPVPTTGRFTTGVRMMLRPAVTEDGKIVLSFTLKQSELVSMNTMKQDNIKIDLPHVSEVEMKQNIVLKSGEEVAIPFGPMTEPNMSMQTTVIPPMVMAAAHPRYTLKIVATKN
jgi:type II secretory pathway component GspD/PulD (secretin)